MKIAAKTDIGRQRKQNEDAFDYDISTGFFVVADGMGGLAAGDIASKTALSVLKSGLDQLSILNNPSSQLSLLQDLVNEANHKIYHCSNIPNVSARMGTTLTAGVVSGQQLLYVHVGDSRIYLVRQGEIQQLTTDHSLVQEMVELGQISSEEARTHNYRNVINRAVGLELTVEVDQGEHQLLVGDKLLICSDGLHDMITSDLEIADLIQDADGPEIAVTNLVKQALFNGGLDNVTAVLIEVD
ncbi:protein phosphatase [Candidatus Poribacteria bacterium]|nr:protein phosphatase [Candidatus Poribacteria bacterium]